MDPRNLVFYHRLVALRLDREIVSEILEYFFLSQFSIYGRQKFRRPGYHADIDVIAFVTAARASDVFQRNRATYRRRCLLGGRRRQATGSILSKMNRERRCRLSLFTD